MSGAFVSCHSKDIDSDAHLLLVGVRRKQWAQIGLDLLRRVDRRIAFQYLTVATNKKFGEVPLDSLAAEESRSRLFEVYIERVRVAAVNLNLSEEGEGDVVGEIAEVFDLRLVPRFLMSKLVTGEAEDGKALFPVSAVERFQPGILRGEAALAGDVDDQ